eukprot:UN29441
MFRCSQPKVGLTFNRNEKDELYLKTIFISNSEHLEPTLWIMDCRPYVNAIGNKVKGAGYENMDHYPFAKLRFMGIDNIHVVRDSREKLAKAIFQEKKDSKFYSSVEHSGWLQFVSIILKGTVSIVTRMVEDKQSIVVHCSDGWDRTSQVCALAQICMDSYYRTFEGFIVLIEKDWLSFGHQFHRRAAHMKSLVSTKENSPIFEQ